MYLETGLAQAFKPRSKYRPARLVRVTAYWELEVPFRKSFGAFRQELSKAIGQLVTAATDKTESARLLLQVKSVEGALKQTHDRLLKRKSPTLKESDAVKVTAAITFNKPDYTDILSLTVFPF